MVGLCRRQSWRDDAGGSTTPGNGATIGTHLRDKAHTHTPFA